MRSACIFFIIVIAIHVSVAVVNSPCHIRKISNVAVATQATQQLRSAAESCPAENCIPASQCEQLVRGNVACANGQPCCSVVKSEFRTACRHHGGECMDSCSSSLQRSVTDCPANTVCCVLV